MPYTKDTAWLKNLPQGAQALGIRVFNAVYAQTKDDNQARMAAWAQIKRKYKKLGDKWVKLMSVSKELLLVTAPPSGAPGVKFVLEEVTLQTIATGMKWGPSQTYYLMSTELEALVFDSNPLSTPAATVIGDELPLQPYTRIVKRTKVDSGTVHTRTLLTIKGEKGSQELGRDSIDVTVCMAAGKDSIKFNRVGELLYFEALALAPGTWTGIDGHTMKYDAGVIQEGSPTFPFQRMKSRHKDRDLDVVGFTTGVALKDHQAWIQGYVFDQQEIKEIEGDIASGKPVGVSPELHSMTSLDSDGNYIAHSISARGFSFVDSPACKTSWVQTFRKLNPEQLNS
jgi:hypothetical protein